jgi:NAD(P)-dependent dehydrogenase (short-subunit alcohol dehydrogenase family)
VTLLTGRRALVTGGASGIGAAVVERLARAGASGAALDLEPALDGARLPDGWVATPADVRDEASLARAVADAGPIDVVVAAAGIVPAWSPVAEVDLDDFDAVMAVNARGLAATLKHAARTLRDGGAIVVIASLNAWRGDPNLTPYAASKHAALGIVRSAALDLGRRGIRVNAVAPGPVATRALIGRMERRAREGGLPVHEALARAAAGTALGRIATEEEVASATLFLASDLAAATTGHLLPVDGGIDGG